MNVIGPKGRFLSNLALKVELPLRFNFTALINRGDVNGSSNCHWSSDKGWSSALSR